MILYVIYMDYIVMYLHRCFDHIPIPTGIPSSGMMYFSPKMKKHRHRM